MLGLGSGFGRKQKVQTEFSESNGGLGGGGLAGVPRQFDDELATTAAERASEQLLRYPPISIHGSKHILVFSFK